MAKRLARRTFLKGVGGVAVALPFLDAMRSSVTADPIKRYVQFCSPHGMSPGVWYTPEGASGFRLTDWASSLAAHADDMLIVRGMRRWNGTAGHHDGGGAAFTGRDKNSGYGISLDQQIAQLIGHTGLPSLSLGFFTHENPSPGYHTVFSGPNRPIRLTQDPRSVFTTLLGDGSTTSGEVMEETHSRRRSILDLVRDDYREAEFGLSSTDRTRLRNHAEYLRSLELSVTDLGPVCAGKNIDDYSFNLDPQQGAAISRAHLQLIALALACDITRVAAIQYSYSVANLHYHWLESRQPGISSGTHHHWTHHPSTGDWSLGRPYFREIEKWHMEEVGFLLDELKRLDTMDGTVVLWGSNEGRGIHTDDEDGRTDDLYVLFGDLHGHFATGKVLDLQIDGWVPPETRHDYLPSMLLTVAKAFGYTGSSFGSSYHNQAGEIPGVRA